MGGGRGRLPQPHCLPLNSAHNHLVIQIVNPVLRNINRLLLQLVHVLKEVGGVGEVGGAEGAEGVGGVGGAERAGGVGGVGGAEGVGGGG